MSAITREQAIAIGGKPWTSSDGTKDRVYWDDWHRFVGLEISYYGTGNVSGATLHGEPISNSKANQYRQGKAYWENGHVYGAGIHLALIDYLETGVREAVAALPTEDVPAGLDASYSPDEGLARLRQYVDDYHSATTTAARAAAGRSLAAHFADLDKWLSADLPAPRDWRVL